MATALQAGAFLRPAPGSIGRFALEIAETPVAQLGKPCALHVRTWALDDDDALHKGRHGDSTQTPECPQGDGWASVSFLNVVGEGKGKEVEKYVAKCSTVSASLGCYLDKDFTNKPFAKQENRCDASLPIMKKIAK